MFSVHCPVCSLFSFLNKVRLCSLKMSSLSAIVALSRLSCMNLEPSESIKLAINNKFEQKYFFVQFSLLPNPHHFTCACYKCCHVFWDFREFDYREKPIFQFLNIRTLRHSQGSSNPEERLECTLYIFNICTIQRLECTLYIFNICTITFNV